MRIQTAMRLIALCIFTISVGALGLTAFTPAAQAAEEPAIEIPVTVTLEGAPPAEAEDYTIVLAADHRDYPMPAGSARGRYRMIITGEEASTLPEIVFSEPGVFTYRIYQKPGDNEAATYDDAVYELLVYVTQARHGQRLEKTVILYRVGQTEKLGEAEFVNCYDDEETICPDHPHPSEPTEPEKPGPTEPDKPEPTESEEQKPTKPEAPEPAEPGTPEPTKPEAPEPAEPGAPGPNEPETPAPPAEDGPPQTGDDTVVWPYVTLLVSGAGLLGLAASSWQAKRVD